MDSNHEYPLPKSGVLPLDDSATSLGDEVSPLGLEPRTITLKGCCSTIELGARGDLIGIRTQVAGLKTPSPRPLDDEAVTTDSLYFTIY